MKPIEKKHTSRDHNSYFVSPWKNLDTRHKKGKALKAQGRVS